MPSKLRGDKKAKKAELEAQVQSGTPVGLLGYVDGEPVAWCPMAPRSTFRKLSQVDHCSLQDNVWSIVCFFVHRKFRGQGFTSRLIQAAVDHALANGANVVEAYPIDGSSPSYRFMGLVSQFERAGFEHVGTTGKWRHVMQLRRGEG